MIRTRGNALIALALLFGPGMLLAQIVTPGIEWVPGRFVAGAQPDGNSVLIDAPQGWIVVDTGRHPAHVQSLLDRVRASGKPVAAIVNTHWHLDHIGGNRALRAAFPQAKLVASDAIEAARSGFLAGYRKQLVEQLAQRPADDPERAVLQRELTVIDDTASSTPDLRIIEPATLDLAGRRLRIGLARNAVTASDLWLFDPNARVVVAGDLITLPAPLFDTACPERWTLALEQFAALRFDWLIPGHGKPLNPAQFVTYREGYYRLLRCANSEAPKLQCINGWIADAGELFAREQEPLARSLLSYYLDQHLRTPRSATCRF